MPNTYSPYKTRLAKAIEKGEGIQELTNQAVFTLGRAKHRAKTLKTREGWNDLLDIAKSEPFVPFPLRTKIAIGQKVAKDIGFFIEKNPNATADDVREEVDRLVQEAELGDQVKQADIDIEREPNPTLDNKETVRVLLDEIEKNPDQASKSLVTVFKRATSLAAHENMKEYSKHIAYLVPFPWNIKFALFTATYHVRLAGMSLINHFRKVPIPKEELEKGLYKNHLSRALSHVADGVSETGGLLIPFLKRIPGVGYISNYVLRHTIGKMIKHTADVLDEDTVEIQSSVKTILQKTMDKKSFDKDTVAIMIANGVTTLGKSETTEFAKGVAVSYRYSRLSKTINLADELTRATVGYAINGAPSEERRRQNFINAQGRKEAREHLRRNQKARKLLQDAHRMPSPSSSLMITPLTGMFNAHDRRSSMHIDTRMDNGFIDRSTTSFEAEVAYYSNKANFPQGNDSQQDDEALTFRPE